MSDMREEVQRQLKAVRRDFEARLGDMIDEIVRAWEAARSTRHLAQLQRLMELVHSLSGNAGFFSLQKISRVAGALEQMLDRSIDRGTSSGTDSAEIDRLIQELRTCALPYALKSSSNG